MTTQSSPRSTAIELLVAYHQNPTVSVRNKLVRLNAGLVRKIAHRVSRQCCEPFEDLEQIGYLGLIRAIERFDPGHGYAFSSFAVPYIRGEMLHFLRDRSSAVKIPRRWQEMQKEGQRVREALTKELGRNPKDSEIAERLNVSINEWQEIKLSGKNRLLLSLDATVSQQVDSAVTLGDTLTDAHAQTLQIWEEDRQQIQRAMAQLEEKTRTAIELVYYSDLSRKEVAEKIGVSPMTVTRRIQRGVEQMIAILQPQPQSESVPSEL
ncbi:RNA polymerase sigma factor SigF [Leptolyngbya sp. FACHB-671]|uniref:RNA polymerase sigma factor SigF n=1 Tax=unclassified Leptolyngbya TaxID=2650499 RepID=UPI0016830DF0|nr:MULTISPECIES: RNA polymerase sigma factor SigF [unclassified Leptolyngbya]MBD1869926.1 RNA polymerase sigma factor SigF [Cyanobacteria bacterium FACHB-471]MBD1998953.1 RNA polymerase sigma factor SigF [Leptolyngbya sp. FACHB-541]MBD2068702.1 RNA polymerase sigma factor SigF [Leptolyngbya sp. FACHB-671]